jgi:hypothetical protein
MPDLVHVSYAQTGQSSRTNPLGMREMQEKAYQARYAFVGVFTNKLSTFQKRRHVGER